MDLKHFLIVVLAIIGLSFFVGRLSTSSTRSAQNAQLLALTDSISTYHTTIGGLQQTVYEKDQLIVTYKQALDMNLIEQDRLKKLHLQKISQVTRLEAHLKAARDSIDLGKDSVVFVHDTVTNELYVRLPLQWSYNDTYLDFKTGVGTDRAGWFDINAKLPGTITLGLQKDGFLKRKPVASFTTPNPYVTLSDIQVVNIQDIKWYDHWYVQAGAGYVLGVLTPVIINTFLK